MAEDAKTIRETFDQLKSERAPFDALYRQVAQYTLPDEASIPEAGGTTEGLEHAYPSESVGIRCARLLAAGLFSNTVSPGAQWFRLRATDAAERTERSPRVDGREHGPSPEVSGRKQLQP